MLHFEGDKDFVQTPTELAARLSDPRFLVQAIPDLQSVTRAEAEEAVFVLRPGVSFVRGTLEVTLRVLEAVAGKSVRFSARSKGIGSTSAVEAGLQFAAEGAGTRVHWTADVTELGGLLKAVPQGLVKASAHKVIADVWSALEAKLAA
jgi:carbon monoxide dehydrogenase subunit G